MTSPTPTPPCLGEREAVARTHSRDALARTIKGALASVKSILFTDWEIADAIIAEHIEPLRTENETLRAEVERLKKLNNTYRDEAVQNLNTTLAGLNQGWSDRVLTAEAERDAAIARAEEAERRHEGKFWIELREPGRVPERKGEFPISGMTKILREFMDARPTAFLTVVTIGYTGPDFQHGPEALQMADARSMERGRKHNARVREAHGDHATKTTLAERDAALAKLAQAEGEIATMRSVLEQIAQASPELDDKDWYPGVYGQPAAYRMTGSSSEIHPDEEQPGDMDSFGFERGVHSLAVIARAALTNPEPPHGD